MPGLRIIVICLLSSVLLACQQTTATLFEQVPSSQTNITFANSLTPSEALNGFTFTNFYNGGGVAVGDVNNDGFTDVFFTGNQASCRLYLNQGKAKGSDFTFTDITEAAGLTTDRWCSGVVMTDINQDGWLDLYISVASHPALKHTGNLLFVNQGLKNGKPVFREMAKDYGLADPAFTTQTAFFDYDLDGDLDAFLLNTAPDYQNPSHVRPVVSDGSHPSTGKLYRNEGIGPAGHPVFKDVSKQAGITYDGLGLGLVVSDFNKDGYPDIYCSNDFTSSDILYLNDGNGHFTNVIKQATAHTSLYGMGVDAADLNNDALPDLMQLDMLPKENNRIKMMLGGQDYDRKEMSVSAPYNNQMQYMRNSLQMNVGTAQGWQGMARNKVKAGSGQSPANPALPRNSMPIFSEVGLMAGVAQTDWSWAALLADFDNDGWRDMYITNGYRKNVTDRDFITFTEEFSGFGTTEYNTKKRLELLDKVPEIPLAHYAFRNTGNGSFIDVSQTWGLNAKSYANGAAYADFDNDGDLDLAVNNVDGEALIYHNRSREQRPDQHYLTIEVEGDSANRQGIGTKVTLWSGGAMQYGELSVVRGYLSSIEPLLHFGLGKAQQIDSLRVEWPGGKTETQYRVKPDQRIRFRYANAHDAHVTPTSAPIRPLFVTSPTSIVPSYQHQVSNFVDFKQTAALHKMLSRSSFALATGDVNGDGLDDCFVGGTYRGSKACLLIQTAKGGFTQKPFPTPADHDDTAALLFDADGDKDLDLYVVSGGCQKPASEKAFYQDQLYLNNGRGDFSPAPANALPEVSGSGSCVVATDFDGDGDLDLFVGGRMIPGQYPLPARSYLLRNDQTNSVVKFTDVTAQVCPWLLKAGLVCSALWTDTNRDKVPDLILAGEWMPITVLQGRRAGDGPGRVGQGWQKYTLHPLPTEPSLPTGWWNSLAQGDFDNDGDLDYIAGNEGLNSLYQASTQEPITMVAKDFNNDGTFDPLMGYFINGVAYPAVPRDALNQQVIQFRRKYQRYADYAQVTFANLLTDDELKDSYQAKATYLQSAYIENLGNNQFKMTPLPYLAQQSPVFGIIPYDFNQDGNLDAVLTGNFYPNEVNMGRQDASVGLVLLGNGHGQFRAVSSRESGLFIRGDARTSVLLGSKGLGKLLVTAVSGQGLAINQYVAPKLIGSWYHGL